MFQDYCSCLSCQVLQLLKNLHPFYSHFKWNSSCWWDSIFVLLLFSLHHYAQWINVFYLVLNKTYEVKRKDNSKPFIEKEIRFIYSLGYIISKRIRITCTLNMVSSNLKQKVLYTLYYEKIFPTNLLYKVAMFYIFTQYLISFISVEITQCLLTLPISTSIESTMMHYR